jgi:single-strand DNA-binding protein
LGPKNYESEQSTTCWPPHARSGRPSTPSGTAIADLSIAVSRFWKTDQGENKEETDFIDVTAYRRTAEVIQKHLRKASSVYIEGRLKLDTWTDRESGKNRSKLKVIAESMQFVGPKPQGQSNESTPSPALAKQREERERRAGSATIGPAVHDEDPTDIPF